MRMGLFLGGLCIAGGLAAQELIIPLDSGWTMGPADGAQRYPAHVPGVVHTDLLRAGVIPDPYQGMNVDSVQWIERKDWTYERMFQVDAALVAHGHIDLVFHGLDTFADVYLNDSLLGHADNMFRTWAFPLKGALHPGPARLKVVFRSPIREGLARRKAFGLQLPADNEAGAEKVSPYIRKAAYQFGWDFAPRLVTSGIWQPVELRCWDEVRLNDLFVDARPRDPDLTDLWISVVVHSESADPLQLQAYVDGRCVEQWRITPKARVDTLRFLASVKGLGAWWPQGSGEHPMYRFVLEGSRKGRICSHAEQQVGVRTVELDRRRDSIGEAFTFRVNGRAIFMKGCNLVPPDMFLPRAGDSAWVALVRHMQRAHMNMVRVWGGGVYPPDAFFSACDTAGILVWQDLMFANLTPGDAAFTANVEAEVRDQAVRWRGHPSLALICGNNELDVAWANWGWQATYGLHGADSARVWNYQVALFEERIPRVLSMTDVPYVPTSPLSNWGSAAGLRNGDLHYWGVWHGDSAFASFRTNVGRFVSEYGFQSYPDSAEWARYLPASALRWDGPEVRARQRSYKGDRPILEAIVREQGPVPDGFAARCDASRQLQALACREAAQAHLDARPWCMGSLCWQLNSPWPGPSWSLLDQDGRWRPAMEALSTVFARP